MKKIWIVNYYTSPPHYASNPRHIKLGEYLQQKGYDVTIVSAGYLRKFKLDLVPKGQAIFQTSYGSLKYIHIKVNKNNGNGIMRMLSIFLFALRLYYSNKILDKPDLIIHNIHAPFDYLVLKYANKMGIKYIAEAWDLWPEAFIDAGLINKRNPLLPIFYRYEKKIYEKAERIIFSIEGGRNYLIDKKWDIGNGGSINLEKVQYINNGVDLTEFDYNKSNNIINDEDLLDERYFKVLFAGALRRGTNIKLLLDAAKQLMNEKNIKFLIYGDGVERESALQYCNENNIDNVIFKNKWLEFKYLPYILSKSSLNVLNYRKSNRGQYGVSPGKLFLYLASGKPIISNNKLNYCLIERFNLGVSSDIKSADDYASKIKDIRDLSRQDYLRMCDRVRETATHFDYKVLSASFTTIIEGVLSE